MEQEKISRERLESPPGKVYTETILEPGYQFQLKHYFYPLIETNKAWTIMLFETGIINRDVAKALLEAILSLESEGPRAIETFNPNYEYFYSHVEHYLIKKIGEQIAGEINIGRTRPEPLARMVCRKRLLEVMDELQRFRLTLLDIAEREKETVMPQWTHYQHAQLSTVGHYLMGIVTSLERDFARIKAAYDTVNECTLGCGALAGSSYPLDRQLVSDLLGFDKFKENTIDCVSNCDFMLETSAALANMMVTLSRLCQDLYTWHTEEFDFVSISDEYAGSSSMMPQKKNPYPFEYVRARAAHAIGDMASAFGTLHNTNFQDIKDVEEEVVYPVFRMFDEAVRSLKLLNGVISSMEFKRNNMLKQAAKGFASCTELAAIIHRRNQLSYRTAHRIVGNLVLRAFKQGKNATDINAKWVNESAREIIGRDLDIDDETVRAALDPLTFVKAHDLPGGPAPTTVQRSIQNARVRLENDNQKIVQMRQALERAKTELNKRVEQIMK